MTVKNIPEFMGVNPVDLETSSRHVPAINVSALVDVIFTLLIFLLLAATFTRTAGLDVSLPEAEHASSTPSAGLEIVVPLQGPFLVDGIAVKDEDLPKLLIDKRKIHDSLLLSADSMVALQRAVSVIDSANRAGFVSVSIATRKTRTGNNKEEGHITDDALIDAGFGEAEQIPGEYNPD